MLSRTEHIRIGHLVLCNQFRHPALLAKMATTLDQISAGRLQLGIGSGSIEDEHSRTGLPWGSFAERSERLAEALEILSQAFSKGVIDFAGSHYTVRDMPIVPGPAQQPRPPVIVGGVGRSTPCRWSRATPTCGTCLRMRSASLSASCRCCDRSATTSAVIRRPSCCRSRPLWRSPLTTSRCRQSARSPKNVSVRQDSACTKEG
ncbi:luciferase-like monooxygenase family protein [Mycobacterium xenopi 4042]|uniref:Luciferase-like monooxygenase family protein n=1 Tax=Mycobacterium xenopi 4042 TaxID=1299334 RepID=X8AH28_MYCXE|nr:luciferase-like monooxygenase family protein [Mycobacterium xenopi 4042]